MSLNERDIQLFFFLRRPVFISHTRLCWVCNRRTQDTHLLLPGLPPVNSLELLVFHGCVGLGRKKQKYPITHKKWFKPARTRHTVHLCTTWLPYLTLFHRFRQHFSLFSWSALNQNSSISKNLPQTRQKKSLAISPPLACNKPNTHWLFLALYGATTISTFFFFVCFQTQSSTLSSFFLFLSSFLLPRVIRHRRWAPGWIAGGGGRVK